MEPSSGFAASARAFAGEAATRSRCCPDRTRSSSTRCAAGADGAMLAAAAADAAVYCGALGAARLGRGAPRCRRRSTRTSTGCSRPPLRDFRSAAEGGAGRRRRDRRHGRAVAAAADRRRRGRRRGRSRTRARERAAAVCLPSRPRVANPATARPVAIRCARTAASAASASRVASASEDRLVLLAGLRALVQALDVEPDVRLRLLAEPLDQLQQARPLRRLVDRVVELGVERDPAVDVVLVAHGGEDRPQRGRGRPATARGWRAWRRRPPARRGSRRSPRPPTG